MAEATKVRADTNAVRTEEARGAHTSKRIRVAEVVAFVGLVAALIGALGPAERVRSVYSWPPQTLPEGTPATVWYTPLLLAARIPESVGATVPCANTPALPSAKDPVTVLATARAPQRVGGLSLTRTAEELTVGVGDDVLARVPLPAGLTPGSACAYRLQVADRRWSIHGGPGQVELGGKLGQMPVVNGLFSALDLRAGTPPSIDVTTRVHRSRTIARQTVAWTIAALCVVASLILVAFERRPRPRSRSAGLARRLSARAHPADAVIAVVLSGWWLLSPAFWDDGWTLARHSAYSTAGGFSNYYDSFGASLPLGYWLEWVQHLLTQSTGVLLVHRLLALLCLAATWVLCRWIFARLTPSGSGSSVALWALTISFSVGAMAWGMTLRQEPVIALLVTAAFACTVRFLETNSTAPLALGAVLVPLAATGHPAGIVSIASLIVVAPRLLRWARSRAASATTIVTCAVALLLLLAFVGADVEQRRVDAQTVRGSSTTVVGWRDEIVRYDVLSGLRTGNFEGYATPLRRASVALMLLAVLAFVLLRRRQARSSLDLPAVSLTVALVLLILTPSKWPWHFGALIGLASLAFASETARLRDAGARSSGWQARPFIVVGAALLAIAWAWEPRRAWNALDLRTLDWEFETLLPLLVTSVVLPLVLLAGALVVLARRRGDRRDEIPWRVASWTLPVLAAVLIVFTAGVLVADTARTSSWTFTRQNLESLRGDAGCGLADDVAVPVSDSARALPTVDAPGGQPTPVWVPATPVRSIPRFALGPAGEGSSSSPWFEVADQRRIGLFVAGRPASSEVLVLEWGRVRVGKVEILRAGRVLLSVAAEGSSILPWRFVAAAELPPREPGANAVRVTLHSDAAPGAAVAITAPVAYRSEPLTRQFDGDGSRSLVSANVRTYFPCVRLPRLTGGIAEVPSSIVTTRIAGSPVEYPGSSPFGGLLDLYRLERLPVADTKNPPLDLVIFGVEQRISGSKLAPPETTTSAS